MKIIYTNISKEKYSEVSNYIKYLSSIRQDKVRGFKFEKDKLRSIFGELLLRYALKEYFNIEFDKCKIIFNKYGKPYIIHETNLKFNLSHSGNIIICAISYQSVGIDIEENKALDLGTLVYCLHENEQYCLRQYNSKEALDLFYNYWVLKESYLKYLGVGLLYPLNKIGFTITKDQIRLFTELDIEKDLSFKLFHLLNKYSVAICYAKKENIDIEMADANLIKSIFYD